MPNDESALGLFADGAMSVPEAARLTGLGRTQLYVLMGTGELAYTKVGSRRLIPRRALVELLARNATCPPRSGA